MIFQINYSFDNCVYSFISVDVSAIENDVQKQAYIEKYALNELCQPVAIENVENINTFVPARTFDLPDGVEEILPKIDEHQKSKVFLQMWESACEQAAENCKSLDDVVNMWQPV